jgi:hypothetical protein
MKRAVLMPDDLLASALVDRIGASWFIVKIKDETK